MRKKIFGVVVIFAIAGLSIGILWALSLRGDGSHLETDALPPGQDPVLVLPYEDESHLYAIQGWGDSLGFPHNGIDFIFNDSVQLIAPYAGNVCQIAYFYNTGGFGSWQTGVNICLNDEWVLQVIFESQAKSEADGQAQKDAVLVKEGDKVVQNQTLGTLFKHGDHARCHWGFVKETCPSLYLNAASKARFDASFSKYNITMSPCS